LTPKLKSLEELQKVDVEILELTRSGQGHPVRLAELERELSQARAALEAEQTRINENDRQRRDLEAQIQADKDTVRKWEGRLTELRTPREYSALSREIDIAKKSAEGLEHQLIDLKASGEEIRRGAEVRQRELIERHGTITAEANQIRQAMKAVQDSLVTLQAQREQTSKACDPPLLSKYEAIRKKRGVALVPVVGGTCKGCHMSLPPQLYNQLRSGQAPIETCPNCHRLIYVPEPPPEASAG
jgi:predicted  nucleic acid-binding Zn-ribbon protein